MSIANVAVAHPAENWLDLIDIVCGDVRRLDSVIRYNSIPVNHQESVAAHSFWVTFYSALIHRKLSPGHDAGVELAIYKYALVHDLSECLTGDVVRTFKYSSDALKSAVDEAEGLMASKYLPEQVTSVLDDAESGTKDPEFGKYVKAVVKAADFMSLFQFMNREVLRGNREVQPFVDRMERDLRQMADSARSGMQYWFSEPLARLYQDLAENVNHPSTVKGV